MKKLLMIITILLLVVAAFSCSKDHEAPTFSKLSSLGAPTNVIATYNAESDSFIITWDMESAEESGVVDYYIGVSETSEFKSSFTLPNLSMENRHAMSSSFVLSDVDSAVYYFAVKAVYDNDYFEQFTGKYSVADSALFVRQ